MNPRRPGIIKYLLSFLSEIHIETTSSKINPLLHVVFSAGRFKLNTASATYSFEDRYSSFSSALDAIKKHLPSFQSALVLGLGLGSIPYLLQKQHHFAGRIDCVEIDQKVIDLAKRYYPTQPLPEQLNIIHEDANTFIRNNMAKYDLIMVDLFIDRDIPSSFHEERFLNALKTSVSPGGIVLFSRLKENHIPEKTLNERLKNIFSMGKEIDTGGNLILRWQAPSP